MGIERRKGIRRIGLTAILYLLLAGCDRDPGTGDMKDMLGPHILQDVKINGLSVPAKYLKMEGFKIGKTQKVDKQGDISFYQVDGSATVAVTVPSSVIAGEVFASALKWDNGQSENQRGRTINSSQSLQHFASGTEFEVSYSAVVKKVDGDWILVDGRTQDAQISGDIDSSASNAPQQIASRTPAYVEDDQADLIQAATERTTNAANAASNSVSQVGDTSNKQEAEPAIDFAKAAADAAKIAATANATDTEVAPDEAPVGNSSQSSMESELLAAKQATAAAKADAAKARNEASQARAQAQAAKQAADSSKEAAYDFAPSSAEPLDKPARFVSSKYKTYGVVRSSPSDNGDVLCKIFPGDLVYTRSQEGRSWWKVKLPDGSVGYLPSDNLQLQ